MADLSTAAPPGHDAGGERGTIEQTDADRPDLTRDERRELLARGVIRLIRAALPHDADVELRLGSGQDGDALTAGRQAATRARRGRGPAATIVVTSPDALGRLVPPTEDAFAEAFLRGDLEIEGEVMAAVGAGQRLDLRRLPVDDMRRLIRWGWELVRDTPGPRPLQRISRLAGAPHSPARDMAAVRFHYDVGNEFFGLWLGKRLAYSCAYFPDGTTPRTARHALDRAQDAKLELIARKLRLETGRHVLDIGSGWGSFVHYAAEKHGADVVGVTLSERQAEAANRRAAEAGIADRARSEVRDYRDLAELGAFDGVVSVGMFEHVGRTNLAAYFRAAHDALKPGALFLNHGIAQAGGATRPGPDPRPRSSRFVDRFVFPDGELVPVEEAIRVARSVGFDVIDVQSLRPHYALTLAAWIAGLEASWDEAVAAAGDEVARTWRLYMSATRLGFERGDLDVCQLLLAKRDGDRPAALPLRPWW